MRATVCRAPWQLAAGERAASAFSGLRSRCLPGASPQHHARFAGVGEAERRLSPAAASSPGCARPLGVRTVVTATAGPGLPLSAAQHKLFVVDGNELLQKAHGFGGGSYGGASTFRRLRTKSGTDTQVQYGFASSILLILRDLPTHIVVVFDPRRNAPEGGEKTLRLRGWRSQRTHDVPLFTEAEPTARTWRHKFFPEYKANRTTPFPQEITDAFPWILEFLASLGIRAVQHPGVEGDDIIASIALTAAEEPGLQVTIVSQDKDFNQLLGPQISIRRTTGDQSKMYTAESFAADYPGVSPACFIDFLALWGDSSDNIPGVDKIGEITARGLLQRFGSLQAALDAAESPPADIQASEVKKLKLDVLAGKSGKSRDEVVRNALLSWTLAELCVRVDPKERHYSEYLLQRPNGKRLRQLFDELEFSAKKYAEFEGLWSPSSV